MTRVCSTAAISRTSSRKVDPALRSEMERHLRPVEGPLGFNKLHHHLELNDLLLADFVRFRLTPLGPLPPLPVVGRSMAKQAADGGRRVFVGRCPEGGLDEPELRPVLAFGDDGIIRQQALARLGRTA